VILRLYLLYFTARIINNRQTTMELTTLSKLLPATLLLFCLISCNSEDNGSDSRVIISTGDTIIALNDLQYQLPVVVQVADITGSPQANAIVSIRLTAVSYNEGWYEYTDTDVPADGIPDKWTKATNVSCAVEDVNNNGLLDAGEDINNNGLLDPDIPTITAHPTLTPTILGGTSSLMTDDNGFGYFTLSYPKTEASWVSVQLIATAEDGMAENIGRDTFQLFTLLADHDPADNPPAFVTSPYGTDLNCATSN